MCEFMICITLVQYFHSEDSSDFTGCKQRNGIQFQKASEQLTSERHKVDAQSGPLRQRHKMSRKIECKELWTPLKRIELEANTKSICQR